MADYSEIQSALNFIDSTDREVWVKVGNAIKSEFGTNGLDLWLDWSAMAGNFNKKSAMSVWKSFKRLIVPIGYVIKLARQNGYQPNKSYIKPSPEERKARFEKLKADLAAAESERVKSAAKAATKSLAIWEAASKRGSSPYLTKKQIEGINIRYLSDGAILVPMLRYDLPKEQAFIGVQTIKPNGQKLFPSGIAKSGSSCRLGDVNEQIIAVCEGYATGCSLRLGFDKRIPVYVAFDSGNLMKVAYMLREKYKKAHVLVCADNDQKTKGNPGIKAAKKVIKSIANASIIYPIFLSADRQSSDFNDLHVNRGMLILKQQLSTAMRAFLPVSEATYE